MSKPLLISIDDFKFYTGISDSFDSNYIEPLIIQATDLATQNVLGTALTIKLRTDYNSNALTGVYDTLYDSDEASVMKMVIWQAYVLGLPRMLYKIGAETISTGDTTEVESIGLDELSKLQRGASATLVSYTNRVKDFLTKNYSDISELSDNTPEYIKPNTVHSDTSQGTTYAANIKYSNF